MFKMIKNFWRELNKVRCLEISYQLKDDEPIIPDCDNEDIENVKLMVDYHSQILKLQENERKSKRALAKYILGLYEKQGLLLTKKQLEYDVEASWEKLKDSNLVNGFNEFQPATKEVL